MKDENDDNIILLTGNIKYTDADGKVKEYKIESIEDLEKIIAEGIFELSEEDKSLLDEIKEKVETLSIPQIIKLLPNKDRVIDLLDKLQDKVKKEVKEFNLVDVLNYAKKKGHDPETFAKYLRLFNDDVLDESLNKVTEIHEEKKKKLEMMEEWAKKFFEKWVNPIIEEKREKEKQEEQKQEEEKTADDFLKSTRNFYNLEEYEKWHNYAKSHPEDTLVHEFLNDFGITESKLRKWEEKVEKHKEQCTKLEKELWDWLCEDESDPFLGFYATFGKYINKEVSDDEMDVWISAVRNVNKKYKRMGQTLFVLQNAYKTVTGKYIDEQDQGTKCCCNKPKGYYGSEKSVLKEKFNELFSK